MSVEHAKSILLLGGWSGANLITGVMTFFSQYGSTIDYGFKALIGFGTLISIYYNIKVSRKKLNK